MTLHAAISNLIQDAASSAALQLSVSCDDRHYIVEYHESGSPVGLGIHWRRFLFNIGGDHWSRRRGRTPKGVGRGFFNCGSQNGDAFCVVFLEFRSVCQHLGIRLYY